MVAEVSECRVAGLRRLKLLGQLGHSCTAEASGGAGLHIALLGYSFTLCFPRWLRIPGVAAALYPMLSCNFVLCGWGDWGFVLRCSSRLLAALELWQTKKLLGCSITGKPRAGSSGAACLSTSRVQGGTKAETDKWG